MSNRKDLRSRIDAEDKRTGTRILDRLDSGISETINGWWYRLIHSDGDAEVAAADYHHAKADVEALKRREERLEERIDQLEDELDEVREEREEAEERLEEASETLTDAAVAAHSDEAANDNAESELETVAYDLLVDVAHGDLGTNGVVAGLKPVRKAALRADVEPDELIEEMRRQAEPAKDTRDLAYSEEPFERSFLKDGQNKQKRVDVSEFGAVRRAIANEVIDDADLDEEKVPDREVDFAD